MKPLNLVEVLKPTTSRCPVCRRACPGEVVKIGGRPGVWLRRVCPEHGQAEVCIASDDRFYWLARGNQANACCGGGSCGGADAPATGTLGRNAAGRGGNPFETLSTCLALIELVDACNLECPTCYANSPLQQGATGVVPLDNLKSRIEGVIQRKGKIEILQLSGGEPTLHPQIIELIEWAQANEKIDYVVLNTNGLRIARDDAFAAELLRVARGGGLQLYLQFDGPGAGGQKTLRGADLRRIRQLAIDRCAEVRLPITLAMTVIPENLDQVGEAIRFGLAQPTIHGITFQPMFGSGRLPAGSLQQPADRLNAADIVNAALRQCEGLLKARDLTPLPCGDPNCAIIGYLIRADDGVHSVSDFLDFSALQGFLKDKLKYSLEDLTRCGCEMEPLGAVLKDLEVGVHDTFRIMIKPFMDAWTWDQDRIDRCCTHVIRPDGKLDSFCRYYAGFPDEHQAP
jgi:uncharacterized radical SAM superfamily Fe-S cluster-containing enzyme